MSLSNTAQYHPTFVSTSGSALVPHRTANDHLTIAVSSLVAGLEVAACRIEARLDNACDCSCCIHCCICVRPAVAVRSAIPWVPTVKRLVSLGPVTRPRSRVLASSLGMSGLVCAIGQAGVRLTRGAGVPLMGRVSGPLMSPMVVPLMSPVVVPLMSQAIVPVVIVKSV